MHEFDDGEPMAQLADQVEQLARLVSVLRNQVRGHRLVSTHGAGLDPHDALETLRTVHRAAGLVEEAELSAVAACLKIPKAVRPTWAEIGTAVDQAAANAHRRLNAPVQQRYNPAVKRSLQLAREREAALQSGGDAPE